MLQTDQLELKKELEKYLYYWENNLLDLGSSAIYPEISIRSELNHKADTGSMYLSRVIYGASRSCKILQNLKYKSLADVAFEQLLEFKNPKGGYYWGRSSNKEWLHSEDDMNMAQAFVLYGLAEYSKINTSAHVQDLIQEQIDFISNTLKTGKEVEYLDGFDEQWLQSNNMSRSFATHFHTMEALVLVYEINKDPLIKASIQDLLDLLMDRFIDHKDYSCIHRFSEQWKAFPNENWAGHNAEFSWVICEAAKSVKDENLIEKTEQLAIKMMDQVIQNACDKRHGGYNNIIRMDGVPERTKTWWPQAEVVLGLINVFKITGKNKYRDLAEDQLRFIRKNFITEQGEWYAEVQHSGAPVEKTPLVFFWKSMYHTIRYYDYLIRLS